MPGLLGWAATVVVELVLVDVAMGLEVAVPCASGAGAGAGAGDEASSLEQAESKRFTANAAIHQCLLRARVFDAAWQTCRLHPATAVGQASQSSSLIRTALHAQGRGPFQPNPRHLSLDGVEGMDLIRWERVGSVGQPQRMSEAQAVGQSVSLDRQPVLEGNLIRARPLRADDFDDLRGVACDPLIWEQHPAKDRAQPDGFKRWFEEAMSSGGALVVIDRSDQTVIGTSRFDGLDPVQKVVEIGWTFLARSRWGGRYNAELKALMLEHAFASVEAVVFRVHSQNHRSQRAVHKLGALHVDTEPYPPGAGDVFVFRLERPNP